MHRRPAGSSESSPGGDRVGSSREHPVPASRSLVGRLLALLVLSVWVGASPLGASFILSDPTSPIYYNYVAVGGVEVTLEKDGVLSGDIHSNGDVQPLTEFVEFSIRVNPPGATDQVRDLAGNPAFPFSSMFDTFTEPEV